MIKKIPTTSEAKSHWAKKADAWNEWADPMQVMAEKFNAPLLNSADLAEGQHILDLASGAGEPAISASKIIGSTGFCCATDFIPEMLNGIKARKDSTENLLLAATDMQALPFADHSFDRIICRFGVMFAPDIKMVISELQRVLKPNGRIALMVWGKREDQTLFKCLSNAIEKSSKNKPDDHHFSIFRFGEQGSLSKHFTDSKFRNIEETTHSFTARASTEKPFWRAQLDMSFSHMLENQSIQEQKQLDNAIKTELEETLDEGKYLLESHIIILTATLGNLAS